MWLQDLMEQYHLSGNVSYRLAQNTCTFDADSAKDQIIYIWSKSGEQKQISEKQACEAIVPHVKDWLNMINETCAPIIESGDVRYLLSGEGCEIPSLAGAAALSECTCTDLCSADHWCPRLFLCNLSGSVLQLERADGNPQG